MYYKSIKKVCFLGRVRPVISALALVAGRHFGCTETLRRGEGATAGKKFWIPAAG